MIVKKKKKNWYNDKKKSYLNYLNKKLFEYQKVNIVFQHYLKIHHFIQK